MKILFVTSTFLKSKEDEQLDFVFEVATAFRRKGHDVMVVAAHGANAEKNHEIDGIKVRRFQYSWPASTQKIAYGCGIAQNISKSIAVKAQFLPYVISNTLALRKAVKEFKPDVVQALWSFPQGWAAALAKKTIGFPLAVHLFGAEIYLAKRYKMPFLAVWSTKHAELLTANSEATRKAALGLGIRKPEVLFCGGVNMQRYNPKNDGSKVRKKHKLGKNKVIFVMGRLVERKGHVFLIKAMKKILKMFPKAKLVIGGGGIEEANIRKAIKELKLENSVILTGRIPILDLPSYYAACDVFCLPAIVDSKGETEGGQGLVIGEAMASGRPVVASNVGGIPDAVKHNANGLLVEQKNPGQLANAICSVLSNKRLAKRLSKAGIGFVEREISYDVYVDKCIKQYERVLKKRGKAYKHIESYYDSFFESERTKYESYRSTEAKSRILDAVKGKTGKLLDLGCGNGELVKYLKERLGKNSFKFYGVDLSKVNIKRSGLKKAAQANLESKLPFKDNCFDVVILQEVIEHLRNRKRIVSEIHRVLKKNGVAVITCPHKYSLILPLYILKNTVFHRMQPIEDWLSKKELRDLMSGKFKNYRLCSHNFFPYHSILPESLVPAVAKIDEMIQNTPVDRKLVAVAVK